MLNKLSISARMRRLRKKSGLTVQELAKAIDVSPALVGHWETGARIPSPELLLVIAAFFGVSVDFLLAYDNNNALVFNPDGELYYNFARGEKPSLHGTFDYSFGVVSTNMGIRKFIYLSERTGGILLNPTIIRGQSHLPFLSLVTLMNVKLDFQYNPFEKSDSDIIFQYEGLGHKYQSIVCDFVTPPRLVTISYGSFVENYLNKTTDEKILYLSEFIDFPELWRRDYD